MKDYALELARSRSDSSDKLNIMREYVQAYILRIMHDEGAFRTTVFLGGTALRFLYNLPRFSEDLDFSAADKKEYAFAGIVKKVKQELALAGYDAKVTYNDEKIVKNAFFKIEGLMYEAGISRYKTQNFSIKIEIDTNPPEGATVKTEVANKYFPISFLTYDISSLFAGKVHALLNRKYTKGRDFFDLGWYLSQWRDITPNFIMLKNALMQTGWKGEIPSEKTWREYLFNVVERVDWKKARQDVENFLERPKDMDVFTKENVLNLIK